jgi:hypothetical protein
MEQIEIYWDQMKRYWEDNGFGVLAFLSVCLILVLFIYNWWTDKRGTYSLRDKMRVEVMPKDSFFNYRQHTLRDSKLELAVKYHVEEIFQRPFYKIRPNFLKNEATGRNLEIDLFNKDLMLAIEIQGVQHYKFSPKFHLTEQHFIDQQKRDQMKALKCRQYGIKLVEIPYNVKERDLRVYLETELRKNGF